MACASLFLTTGTQALRLPNDVAPPPDGARRIVAPADAIGDDVFDAPGVEPGARNQPEHQERDALRCFALVRTRMSASASCATGRRARVRASARRRPALAPRPSAW